MNHEQIARAFLHAYKKPGGMHWAYNGLRDCVTTWQKWGIVGMPDPTPEAIELLRDEVEKDDAFLASLKN